MNCHELRTLLDAYLDDETTAAESAGVRDHLESCRACALQLQRRESLRHLLRGVPYRPATDRVHARVRQARGRIVRQRLLMAAGLLLAIGASAFVVRGLRDARATSVTADAVVDRHIAALMSGGGIDVRSSNQHTVKPWFQGRVEFSPPVVDLASTGFPLIGGRVDDVGGRRAAAIVFGRRDHIIDVFAWPDDSSPAHDARTRRGFQERHWRAGDLSLWAVSDLNDRELDEFVRAFQAATRTPAESR